MYVVETLQASQELFQVGGGHFFQTQKATDCLVDIFTANAPTHLC